MISVAVMAHPRRKRMAETLAERLVASVVWDQKNDIWHTAQRAMLAADDDWHLVIQDDAIISRDLIPSIETMLECVPRHVILSLYFPAHRHAEVPDFQPTGRWTIAPRLIGGVAVVYPTHLIPLIIEDAESRTVVSYDSRIHWPTYYPQPSLVDHADVMSLRRGRYGRRALNFIGTHRSGLDVDWDA